VPENNSNEELDFEELEFGVKMGNGVALALALINVALLIGLIIAVFRGLTWYKALIAYIVLTFILRVLKTYFRNIADSCQEDLDKMTGPFEG